MIPGNKGGFKRVWEYLDARLEYWFFCMHWAGELEIFPSRSAIISCNKSISAALKLFLKVLPPALLPGPTFTSEKKNQNAENSILSFEFYRRLSFTAWKESALCTTRRRAKASLRIGLASPFDWGKRFWFKKFQSCPVCRCCLLSGSIGWLQTLAAGKVSMYFSLSSAFPSPSAVFSYFFHLF